MVDSGDASQSGPAASSGTGEGNRRYGRRALLRAGLGATAVGLAGCESLPAELQEGGGSTPVDDGTPTPAVQDATFYDGWENGEMNGWTTLVAQGDGDADVEELEGPDGEDHALVVSQSSGGGSYLLVATTDGLTGWNRQWQIQTLLYTEALDPETTNQAYHVLPNHEPGTDGREPVGFKVGVRGGDGRLEPAKFTGPAVENEEVYHVSWAEDRWYQIELGHDGQGGYTARVWSPDEQRPAEPDVVATGPVPQPGERRLGLRANGPRNDSFEMAHAHVAYTVEPGPDPVETTQSTTEEPTTTEQLTEQQRFYDGWEDGSADGWEEYIAEGDGSSRVSRLDGPDEGNYALTVSQSTGSATMFLVGTEERFAGWDGSWQVRTLFYTTALDPQTTNQAYHIAPNYEPRTDARNPVSVKVGVRRGNGDLEPVRFAGDIENIQTHQLDWEQGQWYHLEFGHDGRGNYTGRAWRDGEGRSSEPNFTGTGPVPDSGEKALAFRSNGPSFPDFEISHAYVEYLRQ